MYVCVCVCGRVDLSVCVCVFESVCITPALHQRSPGAIIYSNHLVVRGTSITLAKPSLAR